MSAGAKLVLEDVSKAFGGASVVAGLSLSIAEGEFLSLLGPSGCGKSTTLSMITGFQTPDSGDILVDEKRVNDVPPHKRGVGIVFQDYAVFSKLTVKQNLGFGLSANGVPKISQEKAIGEMAEKLSLTSILRQRGDSLNMSEMQRVALGRAIIMKPKLLLLDEPMSNLDASLRLELRGELRQIQKSLGQTVLYVTHDQVEAMAMSDRIAVMRNGQLLQVASPSDIYFRPSTKFVAEFIGDPPINVVTCNIQRNSGKAILSTAVHRGLVIDDVTPREYLLLIRPHNVVAFRNPGAHSAPVRVRLIENYGSEHVLHVDYGTDMLRVVVPPHFAAVDEVVHIALDLRYAHLADPSSDRVMPIVQPTSAS
jgi:multiple sugar transport system ATP-binding protein